MSQQVKFFKRNKLDIDNVNASYTITDSIASSTGSTIFNYVRNAAFTIIPSVWFETAGLVIYESFALGKPVIGADIGPIPELVENGVTGLLFEPGNVRQLTNKINYLISRPNEILEMGKRCRMRIEESYNADLHYERIMKVYKDVLNSKES